MPGINSSIVNRFGSDLPFVRLTSKFPSSDNASCRIVKLKATLISGGGDLLSYPNSNDVEISNDEFVGIEVQPDARAFGTLAADTLLPSHDFSADTDEFDLDRPTQGFASISEAIEDIRQGKVATLSLTKMISFFL